MYEARLVWFTLCRYWSVDDDHIGPVWGIITGGSMPYVLSHMSNIGKFVNVLYFEDVAVWILSQSRCLTMTADMRIFFVSMLHGISNRFMVGINWLAAYNTRTINLTRALGQMMRTCGRIRNHYFRNHELSTVVPSKHSQVMRLLKCSSF